jgi:hypothetical protein
MARTKTVTADSSPTIEAVIKAVGLTPATPAKSVTYTPHTASRVQWFDDRFYKVWLSTWPVPEFYPSSTTVLGIIAKPYLASWRGRVGNEEADYRSYLAKTRGTRTHELIHRLLKRERIAMGTNDQEVWRQVANFSKWFEGLGPARTVAAEETVFSVSNRYAGTLDAVIETAAGLIVVDFKTGSSRDIAHKYQVASYARAWEEMYPDTPPIFKTEVVYLGGAEPKTEYSMAGGIDSDFDMFCHALEMYLAVGEKRPKIYDMPAEIKLTMKRKRRAPNVRTNRSAN